VTTRFEKKLLLDHLKFAEAPRWHDDRLWFADMIGHNITAVDMYGHAQVIAEFDDETSGLGFLPDRTPLVVLRARKQLVQVANGKTSIHSDLSEFPCESLNDMVVDGRGRAYVDAVVRRAKPGTNDIGEAVVLVDELGAVKGATKGLINPNGLAITADGRTLIVAETWAHKLTSFAIGTNGLLDARQTFAEMGDAVPDGICLDAEGAVWVGSPSTHQFLRVARGGHILDEIDTGASWAVACALGGPDRRTLFLLTADTTPQALRTPGGTTSRIETTSVSVPGAGWP
jgi:sugar lactone lactonase YvrE